jgi:hypothetical protein
MYMNATVYLVGTDEDDAEGSLLFHSEEAARECADLNTDDGPMHVYTARATVDLATLQQVEA